jgi:hypothetical protein
MAGSHQGMRPMRSSWGKLAAMVAVSTALMFILMYQLVYQADHVFFSLNRLIASLVMACVMTIVMLGFMWSLFQGRKRKVAVMFVGALAGIVLLAINLNQLLFGDTAFMKAMMPLH